MRTMRRVLKLGVLATTAVMALSSCFRLDSFFYYKPTKVTSYQLGAYKDAELYNVNNFLPDSAIDSIAPVNFTAQDGNTLYGYMLTHTKAAATATILYCHGDAYNLDQYWERAKLLWDTGANVLIFDYEGYGMSQGSPSETALEQDSFAALSYLLNTVGAPMSSIVFYGYSLGSVPAVWDAANYPGASGAKGLIFEAPVGSAALFVQNATDLPLPADTVTNLVIDNAQQIKKVTIPYYWIQGNHDSTIQYNTQGQAVYDNYGGTYKFKTIVNGADHTNVPAKLGGTNYSNYLGLITSFIANPKVQPQP